jgi:hypothetical protein
MEAFNNAAASSQSVLRAIDSAAAASGRVFAQNQGGDAGLSRQKAVSNELTAQIGYWRIQGYEMDQINEVLLPAYISNIQEADRELFKTTTQTTKLSDAAREAEQAFNRVESAVSSVLQSALDPGVGVDPDKILESFGFSEERLNENARRLADIAANGLKGQDWLGTFAAEVPDVWRQIASAVNPREEAAFLLKEFEQGLRPELIDRDAAKARVRALLLGEQNLSAMAQEIAAELSAELGVSLATAQSAAGSALGVSGLGTAVADGAVAELGARDTGAAMVSTVTAQIAANYQLLKQSGQAAAQQWGDGFLTGVGNLPAEALAIVAATVTPLVLGNLSTQRTLEGAATP